MGRIRFLDFSIPNCNQMYTKIHKLNISVKSNLPFNVLIPMLNYRKTFNCSNKTFHLVILKLLSDLIDLSFQRLAYTDFLVTI